jgi:hypothetical protein
VAEPASISDPDKAAAGHSSSQQLRRRALRLEYATLAWNVVGSVIVLAAALAAYSVALAGFGLDSLIEILASLVVVWQLQDADAAERERRALRIIGVAFLLLTAYIAAQSIYVLVTAAHPRHSLAGIVWLALTAAAMFGLVRSQAPHRPGSRQPRRPNRGTGDPDRRATRSRGAARADPQCGRWPLVGGPSLGVGDRPLRRSRRVARAARDSRMS